MMLDIQLFSDGSKRMSSLAISKLLDVRHDNVLRTVDRLVTRMVIGLPPMEENPKEESEGGRPSKSYMLQESESYIVVARLSPEFTAALVKRWRELEQANQQPTLDMTPKYRASQLVEATGYRGSKTAMVEAGFMRHHYPQAVKKLTGDYLLAPFLAYQLANTLLRKMEETHEKLVRQEKTSDKQWERIVKGKDAIRQMFKEDPSVKQLASKVPAQYRLA